MDKKKKMLKRGVSVLLSLVVCLSLMAPTFGDSSGASSSGASVSTETTVTTQVSDGQASNGQANPSDSSAEQNIAGSVSSTETSDSSSETSGQEDSSKANDSSESSVTSEADNNSTVVSSMIEENETEDSNEKPNQENEIPDTTEQVKYIFSVDPENELSHGVYYAQEGTSLEDMAALLPKTVEAVMEDETTVETVPVIWQYIEEDAQAYIDDPESNTSVRFMMTFPEEYELAFDKGNPKAFAVCDLPWLIVSTEPYTLFSTMRKSISLFSITERSPSFGTILQGNGESLITSDADSSFSTHRLYLVNGGGTVAFCAAHGEEAPDGMSYSWDGTYVNSSIAAILDETIGGIYDGMVWNGYSYSAEEVRQAVQAAIYCFTNEYNASYVSIDQLRAVYNRSDCAYNLCVHLVNDIAPKGSSTKYALYKPASGDYQEMIIPTEYEPGEPETPPEVSLSYVMDIWKSSTNPSLTNGNSNYSLNGARFRVAKSDGSWAINTANTDGEGHTSFAIPSAGTYYVQEIQAPKGFKIDPTVHTVNVSEANALSHTGGPNGTSLHVNFNRRTQVFYFEVRGASAYTASGLHAAVWMDPAQSDLVWLDLTDLGNGTFSGSEYVDTSRHPYSGTIYVHVYQKNGGYILGGAFDMIDRSTTVFTRVDIANEPIPLKGYIELQKASTRTDISNSNSSYSLQGAVYGVYTDPSCTQFVGDMVTNGSGYVKSGALDPMTYYVREKSAPSGFAIDPTVYKVTVSSNQTTRVNTSTVTDEPFRFSIALTKSSTNTTVTDNSDAYQLSGAEYTLYRGTSWTNCTPLKTYTTDANGKITTEELPLLTSGNYYFVKETKPSAGYTLNNMIYRIAANSGSNSYSCTIWHSDNGGASWSQIYTNGKITEVSRQFGISTPEVPKTFNIQLGKTTANASISDGNSCYSYEGAVYTLYWDQMDDSHIGGRYTTDANGNFTATNVPIRSSGSYYYLKETTASPGYMLDETIWRIRTVDASGTNNFAYTVEYSVDNGKTWDTYVATTTVDSNVSISITSEEPPANDPIVLTITKIDDPGEGNPLSEYWEDKSGAQFTVNFYAGQYGSVNDLPGTPTRSWVIETKYNETAKEYMTQLTDAFKVSGDDFYYDDSGVVVVPLGTITIEETKPAFGYTTEGGYLVDGTGEEVSSENGVILLNVTQDGIGGNGRIEAGNNYTKEEYHQNCSITLHKKGDDGQALEGATFALQIQNSDGGWDDVEVGTTDASGNLVFDELVFGTYKITETGTNNGYTLLKDPIIVELPYSSEDGYADANPTFSQDGYDYYCDVSYTITNTSTFELPMTGASGIGIIPVLGASILAAFAGMYLYNWKRRRAM